MELIILATMGLELLLLAGLILVGGRALTQTAAGNRKNPPERWPPVALIVPVTGAAPGLAANLQSLLTQDYPDYQVNLVTRSSTDPATPIILALIPDYPQARHLISGPAVACGQKNHNLLAGLRALGNDPEILVFGDANQVAPPFWLKELVNPLARGEALVISGYHHIIPQGGGIAALGRAISVLILYLTKGITRLNQPWGGATAIKRTLFEALQVDQLWARTVVDDVSLAAHLRKAKIPVSLAPAARLATFLTSETLSGWEDWLTRQWLYLKFCLPGTWLAGGVIQHLLLALTLLAGLHCLLTPFGMVSLHQALAAALFLATLTGLGLALRSLHPSPGPWPSWLAAFYVAIAMASWCHLRTWFVRKIIWRGLSYQVTGQGKVTSIQELG